MNSAVVGYLLVIIIGTGGSRGGVDAPVWPEFKTKAACVATGQAYERRVKNLKWDDQRVSFECIRSDGEKE